MRVKLVKSILVILFLIGCQDNKNHTFVASGIVEGTSVKVAAQTGGLILEVKIDEGDEAATGQVIAVIDTEKLVYQMEQIQAGLGELQVQRSMSLNTLKTAELEYEHIQTKYERFQDLYKKSSASKQTLDDLKNAFDVSSSGLENAKQGLAILASKRKGLAAQLKFIKRQIKDATITAPLTGTIATKYYEAGETIPPGAAMVEIINLNNMWTKVYVSEKQLPEIKVNQEATVHIDGTEQTLPGRVSWISSKAEFTPKNILTEESRTSLVYAIKVEVENPNHILKHGMPVEIELKYGE